MIDQLAIQGAATLLFFVLNLTTAIGIATTEYTVLAATEFGLTTTTRNHITSQESGQAGSMLNRLTIESAGGGSRNSAIVQTVGASQGAVVTSADLATAGFTKGHSGTLISRHICSMSHRVPIEAAITGRAYDTATLAIGARQGAIVTGASL